MSNIMSSIAQKAKAGLPLSDAFVLDCHCHIGEWSNFNIPSGTAESMLASMDCTGTDTAIISAHSAIGPDFVYGNKLVMNTVKKYPQRFMGYVTINPNFPELIKSELERCFTLEGMIGIKLHPSLHGCSVDHRNYHEAYMTAVQKRCPVLVHVWGKSDVASIDRIAGQYPQAILIMGHTGGEPKAMEDAVDIIRKHENVYGDLALSAAFEGNVEWFMKEVGSKKILYGSDLPFLDPRPTLGRVALADISEEEKLDILGMNMKRILDFRQ